MFGLSEARKAVESLGISGHNYPSALKTLKRLCGNHHRVTAAHLRKMTDCPPVQPGDRYALRDYHYRVKACVSWCSKLGQTAVLQNPEYLSKAAMKLPGSLRYRWYEKIQDRYDSNTLGDFEQWLQRKVETLFNPFEDYINEQGKNTRSRPPLKSMSTSAPQKTTLHQFSLNTVSESMEDDIYEDSGAVNVNVYTAKSREKCIMCPASHRLVYCDNYKLKPLKERKQIVYDQRLCFNCLKQGHGVGDCPSDRRCLKNGCGQKHHTLLHDDVYVKTTDQPKSQSKASKINEVHNNQVKTQFDGQVALQILPVKICGANGSVVNTCALLDAGSDATLIRKDLAEQLQLDEPVKIDGAWVVNKMNVPVIKYDQEQPSNRWKHLEGVPLPDIKETEAKLLIGSNMAHLLVHLEIRQGQPDEPIAVRTALGWTLFGNVNAKQNKRICSNKVTLRDNVTLHNELEKFWQIDSYGTTCMNHTNTLGLSREDERAMEILERTTTKVNGHYAIGLLWKEDNTVLPNNRNSAVSRLHATERKLKKQPDLAKKYQEVLDEYLKNGHCKKLTPEEAACTSDRTYMVSSTPCRCQPQQAWKTAHLLNNLVGILMRFRSGKIGIMADVEKMFHQYINNEARRFKTFIANRIAVIHDNSRPSQWRWVESSSNSADHASRVLLTTQAGTPTQYKPSEGKNIDELKFTDIEGVMMNGDGLMKQP
ncbi:hypothetical protein QZH41_001749 [Actinostola sp. cb2023]|nr:hypothetical protein QZH41_001749 [Actinostola sp. cb2023]